MKVIEVESSFGLGGGQRVVESISLGMHSIGIDVSVVSLFDNHTVITDNIEAAGIHIEYMSKSRGFDFSMIGKLKKYFLEKRPDVVHTHLHTAKYAITAARQVNVPVVVHTVHNVANKELPPLDRVIQKSFYRRHAAIPVAISPIVRKSISDLYGIPLNEIPMIYNGVDRKVPGPSKVPGRFEVVHIGRYEDQKNHELLVRGFCKFCRQAPDAHLTLLGDGPRFNEVKALISKLGMEGNITQEGSVDDVMGYLASADLFVLPSKFEGLPISLIEAFIAGVPSICTAVGGVPDVLEDGVNGLLCSQTEDDFCSKMSSLYRDPDLMARLAAGSKASAAKYSCKTMTTAYAALFETLIDGGRR